MFCQNIKVCYFRYKICERRESSKINQVVFYALQMQNRPIIGALSKPLSLVYGYKHNPKLLWKLNLETNNQFFYFM